MARRLAVTGVHQTISEIKRFGEEAKRKLNLQTEVIAFQIEQDAIRLAPRNMGKLWQTIRHKKVSEGNYKVTVNEFYGAYMEFGTGAKVQVPAGWEQMAASFKGKTGKSFDDFVEAMKIWMRQKGYDEKNAWIACINILHNGQEPRPFLYPAWIKGKADYEKNLKQLLKNLKRTI